MRIPSLTILWLATPLIWLRIASASVEDQGASGLEDVRCKAHTTGIFLELRVIKTLLDRKCTSPRFVRWGLVVIVYTISLRLLFLDGGNLV